MEKIALVGINSQYIHTNLAIRYLKRYVEKYSELKISLYETNINNQIYNIIKDLFNLNANHYIFSTYIWNKEFVFRVIKELKKIMPNIIITLGGPEVTYNAQDTLFNNLAIDYILIGEGEKVLLNFLLNRNDKIKGVASLKDGKFNYYGNEILIDNLDMIPFPYTDEELNEGIKILYYESSRGCPFSCSYCLSSIDKGVRYWSLERVKNDIDRFLKTDIRLVKFVDRTFNLKKDRYLEIWNHLLKNYRSGIIFHFEINANIFDDEILEFLKNVPENYFQFEIGVQSINRKTMDSIDRRNLLEKLNQNIRLIPKNIDVHVDLIAGLPYDTYESFKKSFEYVYRLNVDMIQLGFLKILTGTRIHKEVKKYEYEYMDFPPYEVLSSRFISYGELIKLKNIEKVLDYYYNSHRFDNSIGYLIKNYYVNSFDLFEEIASYYVENKLLDVGHKTIAIFEHLMTFFKMKKFKNSEIFKEYLKFDYLLLGKPGYYPDWFKSEKNKQKYSSLISKKDFSSLREGIKKSEFEKFFYDVINHKNKEIEILFDYSRKKTRIEIFYKNNAEKS